MSGVDTCEHEVQRADHQHSWADGAVPLRRGFHHEQDARIVPSPPQARIPRGTAIAGLCVLALGLVAVVVSAFQVGSTPHPEPKVASPRQYSKRPAHHPRHSIRHRDQTPAGHLTVEREQPNPSAEPEPARSHSPAPGTPSPSIAPPQSPAMPTTAPSSSSTPSSPPHPEFGL